MLGLLISVVWYVHISLIHPKTLNVIEIETTEEEI